MNAKKNTKLLAILLALVAAVGLMSIAAQARFILPQEKIDGWSMWITEDGLLHWEESPNATGYRIDICEHPGIHVYESIDINTTATVYDLFGKMDAGMYESETYRLELIAKGVENAKSSFLFYYDSPYEKLEAPINLHWIGDTAVWDPVPHADSYNVYVCATTTTGSLSVRSGIKTTSLDFSYLSPEDGWYFEVIAFADGYRQSETSESPRRGGGSRSILPRAASEAPHMTLDKNGILSWDSIAGATGYTIDIYRHPGMQVYESISVNSNSYDLFGRMDEQEYDSADYRIEMRAKGTAGGQNMILYYDSPYERLEAPTNLRWVGHRAEWDPVPHAEYYNVYLTHTTTDGGISLSSRLTDPFVYLTEFEPQGGWYFEVIAYADGYRHSVVSESPRKDHHIGVAPYDSALDEYYSGGKIKLEMETAEGEYNVSYGNSISAPEGATVTVTALPEEGYRFVEWRIRNEKGEVYSQEAVMTFPATQTLYLVGIFDYLPLTEAGFALNAPIEYGKPDFTPVCNESTYDVEDLTWFVSSTGKDGSWSVMNASDSFEVGKHYKIETCLSVKSPYAFAVDDAWDPAISVTVNGSPAQVFAAYEQAAEECVFVKYHFGILNDTVIEQIDINSITEPVVGESPLYTCAIAGNGYTVNTSYDNGTYAINGICWYDVTFDMWVRPKDTFQIGHEYKVFVDVKTESGYEFYTTSLGSSYKPAGWGYINGNYATLGMQSDGRFEQSLSWTFTCQPKPVSLVEITDINAPVAGTHPDFTAKMADPEHYRLDPEYGIVWYDGDMNEMTPEDTFKKGVTYRLMFSVIPVEEDGLPVCRFVNDKTAVTINGNSVVKQNGYWDEVSDSPKRVTVYYTFSKSVMYEGPLTVLNALSLLKAINSGEALDSDSAFMKYDFNDNGTLETFDVIAIIKKIVG